MRRGRIWVTWARGFVFFRGSSKTRSMAASGRHHIRGAAASRARRVYIIYFVFRTQERSFPASVAGATARACSPPKCLHGGRSSRRQLGADDAIKQPACSWRVLVRERRSHRWRSLISSISAVVRRYREWSSSSAQLIPSFRFSDAGTARRRRASRFQGDLHRFDCRCFPRRRRVAIARRWPPDLRVCALRRRTMHLVPSFVSDLLCVHLLRG